MTGAALRVQRYRIVQSCVPRTYCATLCPSPTIRVQLVPGTSLLPRGTVPHTVPADTVRGTVPDGEMLRQPSARLCGIPRARGEQTRGDRGDDEHEVYDYPPPFVPARCARGPTTTHCKPLMQHRLRGAPGSWEVGVGGFGVEVCTGTVRSEWYGQPGM
jgi:hypothetical protein